MQRPSMAGLAPELADAARALARVLGAAGHRAWLVGGAVRDLALARTPKDIDLASAAHPGEVERLFPRTHAVGRAFGTVVVHAGALDVQVTTFRSDAAYQDGRRPSAVRYAATLEEDAERRDFTCNALYLDPLDETFADPTGGLADLAARRLRCVGDAAQRFGEDGLRLLRLARFAAELDLLVPEREREAARGSRSALRGVSPERVLAELERMAEGRAPATAVTLLLETAVLEGLPGLAALPGPLADRVSALVRWQARGAAGFFATLFRPPDPGARTPALEALRALRPSRELLARVRQLWELEEELGACVEGLGELRPARWIRLVREPEFDDAVALFRAWHPAVGAAALQELERRARALEPGRARPELFITSAELASAGLGKGPLWGELLRAAEDLQLDGAFASPAEARAWLARAVGRASGRREDPPQGEAQGIPAQDPGRDEESGRHA